MRFKTRAQRQSTDWYADSDSILGGHGLEPVEDHRVHGGGGGGSSTTKTEPWAGQQQYLTDTFKQAQNLYNNYQPEWYPGQVVAPLSPEHEAANQYAMNYASRTLPSMISSYGNQLGAMASGDTPVGQFSGQLANFAGNMMQQPISTQIGQNLPYMGYNSVTPGQANWMSVSGPGAAPQMNAPDQINPMSASAQAVQPGMTVNPWTISGIPQAQSMSVNGGQISNMPMVNPMMLGNAASGYQNMGPNVGMVDPAQINLSQFGINGMPISANPNAAINQMLSGQVDTSQMNSALNAAFDPLIENFQRAILPSIQDQEIMSGQMGGSTGDVARGLAAEGLADAMGNISSQFAYDAYNRALDRQGQGANLAANSLLSQLGIGGQLAGQQAGLNQQAEFGNIANQLQAYGMGGDIGLQLAGLGLQSELANQQAGIQAGGMNQSAILQAALANQGTDLQSQLANQSAGLQSQGMNIDSFLQAALANQGAGMQAQGMNLDAMMQSALANQGADLQAQGMTMDNYLQSMLANQQTGLQTGLANQQSLLDVLGLNQQSQLANQAAYGNTQGLNLDAMMQAQLANQGAGLTAGSQNLQSMLQSQIAGDSAMQGWAQLPGQYANLALQGLDAQSEDAFRALTQYPQLAQMGMYPSQIYQQIGDQYRMMDQANIDNAMNQWNFYQNYPIDSLNQYANIVAGNNWGSSVTAPKQGGGAMGALGGAMSGAQMGSAFGPWGTAIGAIGGGILGF